jgi:hypothetical protein
MTSSAKSLFYFGLYAFGTGLLFLTFPEPFLALAMLPAVHSGWARVIGLLALVIGCYDIFSARSNLKPFIQISVPVRFGFALGTILLFVSGLMPVSIVLLGGVDALGALWTMMALRSEASKR